MLKVLRQLLFEAVRDARYLKDTVRDSFLRRSSWLYPQDGCWIRAELARKQALQNKLGNLLKVFIFGALSVKTANALAGHVTWWYHVAPIFKDPSGKVLVLDPAIDPFAPLAFEEWVLNMVPLLDKAQFSLCAGTSYSPMDTCATAIEIPDSDVQSDQVRYLNLEWANLVLLSRNPEEELGDNPPWLP